MLLFSSQSMEPECVPEPGPSVEPPPLQRGPRLDLSSLHPEEAVVVGGAERGFLPANGDATAMALCSHHLLLLRQSST